MSAARDRIAAKLRRVAAHSQTLAEMLPRGDAERLVRVERLVDSVDAELDRAAAACGLGRMP